MKEKLVLVSFGGLLGLLVLAVAYPMLTALNSVPEGSQFESVEDFQRAMLKRDERDLKADESVSLRSIIHPHPSLRIMYDLIPGLEVKFQGVPVRINSCGFRGKDVAIAKPENTYRIVLLGDSFAFGWGVEEEESFARVMESRLNKKLGKKLNVEVLNFGVPGYSTFQQVSLFEEKGLDFNPDAVLVYFVENDFGLPFFIKSVHQDGAMVPSTQFAKASWKGDDPLINEQNKDLMDMLDPNHAIGELVDLSKKKGIEVFFAINPRPAWKKDKARLWILRQRRKDMHFVRMRSPFLSMVEKESVDPKDLSLPSDPHPSAIKHRFLGEILAGSVYPVILQWLGEG